jgi:hypothetical protein
MERHVLHFYPWIAICSAVCFRHRWARLLKQQTSITVYRLSMKGNKLPFSVCRTQTEVCSFRFPYAANRRKLPFSVSSVICIYVLKSQTIYIYMHYIYMCVYVIYIYVCLLIVQTESFVRLFTKKQTKVIRLLTD